MIGSFPTTRHRRLRQSPGVRKLVAETALINSDLILPVFIREDDDATQNVPYPGFYHYAIYELKELSEKASALGISALMLFPIISSDKKDPFGLESTNPNNLLIRALNVLKSYDLPLGIWADVALDPYTTHGHDGIIIDNKIDNDTTINKLIDLTLLLAKHGVDAICPSDMMDGRVSHLRSALDANGFQDTLIVSYTAKYASCFYGPFRNLLGVRALEGPSDKKTYQMDYANVKEALHEAAFDVQEGADMLIVKPGLPYLDVITKMANMYSTPVLGYQVSGEYVMVKSAAKEGYLDEKLAFLEMCMAFKRAGARAIITYAAIEIAEWLTSHNE